MTKFFVDRHRAPVLVLAAALPLASCALAAGLGSHVTAATSTLVLVTVVVAAAATGDRWTGVVAAVSGGAWFDFYLVPPVHTFRISDADDVEVAVLLVVIGLAVTELTLWGRRQQASASEVSGYLDGVLNASRIIAADDTDDVLVAQVADGIAALLDADACRFVRTATTSPRDPVLGADGTVTVRGAVVDVDHDGLPTLAETIVPTRHHGVVLGAFLVTASTHVARPPLERRRVAVLLADQVVAALVGARP